MLQLNEVSDDGEDDAVMVPLPATVPELKVTGFVVASGEPIFEDQTIWGQATASPLADWQDIESLTVVATWAETCEGEMAHDAGTGADGVVIAKSEAAASANTNITMRFFSIIITRQTFALACL